MPIKTLILEHVRDPAHIAKNILWRFTAYKSESSPVFILGPSRCGTTLLKSLIASHSNLWGLQYETTGLLEYHNIFTLPVQEIDKKTYDELLSQSGSLIQFYDKISHWFVQNAHAKRFVDKVSPVDPLALYWWRRGFPNGRFVFIIRDGRDSYASAKKIDGFYYTNSVRQYARYWKRKARGWIRCAGRRRFYLVRYEDLVANPESCMDDVMSFVGETFEPQQLTQFRRTTNLHRDDEKHRNLARPISTRSVRRWEEELSKDEQKAFAQVAGKELEYFGYEP